MHRNVGVKKQKKQSEQKRLQRKRSQKIVDENASYGPPDKQQHFDSESTTGHKKRNSKSRKVIPLQSKSENRSDKVPTIGATVKAKYDGEWFTGKLVAYNKEIDQWTIYFKEDDYTDHVIFPDD